MSSGRSSFIVFQTISSSTRWYECRREVAQTSVCLPVYFRKCFRPFRLKPDHRLGEYLDLALHGRFRFLVTAVFIQVHAQDELFDMADIFENVPQMRFGVPNPA
jgi:hypothetical protein